MTLSKRLRLMLRRVGFDVHRYVSGDFGTRPDERRLKLLEHHGINLVFDVGANIGQYASNLRHSGFQGRIVSFEPTSSAFRTLQQLASPDPAWEVVHGALGDFDGSAEINVGANSQVSSLLAMLPTLAKAAPDTQYVAKESITVQKLSSIFDQYVRGSDKPFVKIDTQGFEKKILEGAAAVMERIGGLQLETSVFAFYEGEILMEDMIAFVKTLGFTLMAIEPGFTDETSGQMLQADLLFFRPLESSDKDTTTK